MAKAQRKYDTTDLIQINSKKQYEFNGSAVEINIIDRRGKTVWKTRRVKDHDLQNWDGVDLEGHPVAVGTYICKLTYTECAPIYVPFVFMR